MLRSHRTKKSRKLRPTANVKLRHGASGTTLPTMNKIGRFVGTFKRLTNREIGINLWQSGSNDRIVRSDEEYIAYMEYMEANPRRWLTDEHYVGE